MAVTVNDVFGGSEFLKAHGAACMKLLSAYSDLCPETKLEAICKPG
jgi:hypothetical protein